jgi:hypothetical protein
MQARIERAKTASVAHSVGRFAILAGVPLIATLALSVTDPAFAACGASHPAGVRAASASTGAHAATSRPASGGGGGGGGGSLKCAGGSSAAALRGLPTAASGRVVETVAHGAHTTTLTRTAPTKTAPTKTAPTKTAPTTTANASAHVGAIIRPAQRAVARR